jgi:hypothetical protein
MALWTFAIMALLLIVVLYIGFTPHERLQRFGYLAPWRVHHQARIAWFILVAVFLVIAIVRTFFAAC